MVIDDDDDDDDDDTGNHWQPSSSTDKQPDGCSLKVLHYKIDDKMKMKSFQTNFQSNLK